MDDIMASAVANSTAMASAEAQASMSIAMTKKSMDFQASMTASLINGGLQQSAEMRDAGLAAQGIGGKLNVVA